MKIDPKFLKIKSKRALVLRALEVPEPVLRLLKRHGVNVSAVCREAIEQALRDGVKSEPETVQISFKAPAELLDRAEKAGVGVPRACRDALEKLALSLKSGK